ncbi:hypothetical protein L210DRAFT_2436741 [Boletus edulis BED1]|uniref:Uncharacterized protein n=1 Tax=Boletus edulis BED1 TaxID=1328754 RepID=A0AAD4GDH5_BOLED|nr:hypothetical protein L210DRAFT_2436741 [Boletus edulis BED1]
MPSNTIQVLNSPSTGMTLPRVVRRIFKSSPLVISGRNVAVPVLLVVNKSRKNNATPSTSTPSATPGTGSGKVAAVTGGNGTTITTANGTTFTYINSFGGTWYWDPNDPFNNNAQPNSWTPPLNQSFKLGTDKIFGVNLGGWLVTEPFMQVFQYIYSLLHN